VLFDSDIHSYGLVLQLHACVICIQDIFSKRSYRTFNQDPWHPVKFHVWLGKKSRSGNITCLLCYVCSIGTKQISNFCQLVHSQKCIDIFCSIFSAVMYMLGFLLDVLRATKSDFDFANHCPLSCSSTYHRAAIELWIVMWVVFAVSMCVCVCVCVCDNAITLELFEISSQNFYGSKIRSKARMSLKMAGALKCAGDDLTSVM